MNATMIGKVVSKYDVRIYIYSNMPNIRRVFHKLHSYLSRSIIKDAECSLVILSNQEEQYHTMGMLNEINLWKGLKKIRNQYRPELSYIQLAEDISIHSDCQIIIINSDEQGLIHKRINDIAALSRTGVTFINVNQDQHRQIGVDKSL